MNLVQKWEKIIHSQQTHLQIEFEPLRKPISDNKLLAIENLIKEPVPSEFKLLYQYADGQNGGEGLFLGGEFINSEEIINTLEFSLELIKPKQKIIPVPKKSKQILDCIVDFYLKEVNESSQFKPKQWFKIEFSCGLDSFGGPHVYLQADSEEYEIFEINDYSAIEGFVDELHQLEPETYNWDELELTVYSDQQYLIKRTYFDLDEPSFTSTPPLAIKKKYFHYKWLPIFSDYLGNYIGIDLDPDIEGKKGQVISFGEDEEDMLVIAQNIEALFDAILNILENDPQEIWENEEYFLGAIRAFKNESLL